MTRVGRRLIEDFLLPSLNDQRYGERLRWVDQDQLLFSIRWSHKNAAKWSLEDTVVFQDWDRMKGHFHPENPGYYMQSKQRFRAALYKLNTVRKIKTQDKHTKMYQLVLENDKKRNIDYPGKLESKKEKNLQHSRPSVICRNANYIEKRVGTPLQHKFRTVQIKKENSLFSEDSTTPFSDNSRSSNDRCFSDVNEVSRIDIDEAAEVMLKLGQEAVKKEDKKSVDYSCTIFTSARIKAEKWVKSECREFDDSQFSKNEVHSTTCDTEPMDMSHRIQKPVYCSFQQIPSPVANYPKMVNSFQSSRHVLALPSPVYNKATSQKLLPRKNDLSQPVDLSVKRDFYDHPNIPVSAR